MTDDTQSGLDAVNEGRHAAPRERAMSRLPLCLRSPDARWPIRRTIRNAGS